MRATFFISIFFILLIAACLDRLSYDIDKGVNRGITIDGSISDQPGPYEIRVYNIFDIESKETRKMPVQVSSLEISDDGGNAETLKEIDEGVYQTSPTGIRGKPGGVYKLTVELFDGRIYESLPDTILQAAGSIDSLYLTYNETYNEVGTSQYSFDVLFDASFDEKITNHVLWKFTGTFQAETHPEWYNGQGCFWLDELTIPTKCNFLPPCSGYRNIGQLVTKPILVKKYDCTCCTCWYSLFNPSPILSDDHFGTGGHVTNVKAQTVPLNPWTLEHKIRLEVSQMSLTSNTFRFWKAIRDQQKATGNLFQPISGKIPSNFIQVSGQAVPIQGLFFATSVTKREKYVERWHLPPKYVWVVSQDTPIFKDDCRLLFSNSTNKKPAFWKD